MADCGCLPGTPANGWHEIRSEKCLQAETAAFARLLVRVPDIVATINAKRRLREPHARPFAR